MEKSLKKILIKLKKICNDDQEINPKTGRCINKCKENEERHPVLKICIAKCKNGKIRDKITGRCIKIKTINKVNKKPILKMGFVLVSFDFIIFIVYLNDFIKFIYNS